MIKVNLLLVFCVGFILFACKNDKSDLNNINKVVTVESLKSEIKKIEDTLNNNYKMLMSNKITQIHPNHFINATQNYLKFYRKYPKDDFAPVCLDKVQQLYTQQKQYSLALKYIDTLIVKYPNYKNNSIILLNAGSMCDAILNDKNKMINYYQNLLKKYPNLDKDTKEMVSFRLKNSNLSFDEMILLQSKK